MRNNNSELAFNQKCGWRTVLGAAKTNITPVSHNSLAITEDGDLILIWFHENPPLNRLIVPSGGTEVCPPLSLVALYKLYELQLWLHHRLRPGCRI